MRIKLSVYSTIYINTALSYKGIRCYGLWLSVIYELMLQVNIATNATLNTDYSRLVALNQINTLVPHLRFLGVFLVSLLFMKLAVDLLVLVVGWFQKTHTHTHTPGA